MNALRKADYSNILTLRIREFLVYLKKERGYGKWTLKAYKEALGFFTRWAYENNLADLMAMTRQNLESCREYLKDYKKITGEPLQTSTMNARLLRIRGFFKWLTQKGHILYNPALGLKLIREERRLPRNILTPKEVRQILSLIDTRKLSGIRDRAIIELFYSTGIRRRELTELNLDSLDFNQKTLFIRRGKNQKDRILPVGRRAILWVKRYILESRPKWQNQHSQNKMFLDQRGFPLSGSLLGNMVRYRVLSIGKSGSCHIFRHSMATHMMENGADLRYVQELLGHESIETTKVYTHVSIGKLKEIHAATIINIQTKDQPAEIHDTTYKRVQGKRPAVVRQRPGIQGDLPFLVENYKEELRVLNYSALTIRKKDYALRDFLRWSLESGLHFIKDVSKELIENYIHYFYDKKPELSARTRIAVLEAIKGFFGWAYAKNHILINPAGHIEYPKSPKSLPRHILTPAEVKKIFEAADLKTPVGFRDRAILELLYSTGVRRKEICDLLIEDINFEGKTLLIREGKGKKDRWIPVGSSAVNWLEKYAKKVRPLFLKDKKSPFLFLSMNADRLAADYLGIQISLYVTKAEIGKKGGCLLFRHSMATTMLENGADIRYIQQMLGHSELSTTQLYTHVSLGKLKEIHSKTHPAEKSF